MTQEFINDCLCILNEASSPYDHLDYDDESKEFVAYYYYDVADPDGMGGLDTKVHEAYRYSEEEILELMYGLCPGFYADEALEASCIIQSELPKEAWDICGIEELDLLCEINWEIESDAASWAEHFMHETEINFGDYLPW